MEGEPVRKTELISSEEPSQEVIDRRGCLILGGSLVAGGLLAKTLWPIFTRRKSDLFPELTTPLPPPVGTPLPKAEATPIAETTPAATATVGEIQLSPAPAETPTKNRYEIGGINFVDQEKPLGIAYPEDFEGERFVNFNNLQILVSDNSGSNYEEFTSQFGNRVFVYPDRPSGTFVLNLHDGWYLDSPLEAEPLRELIEGNLRNPHPQEVIEANLQRITGHPFFFSQNGQNSRFVVTQAKRMDAGATQEFLNKPGELSLILDPIENPENSFILMACSGRQPGEPNETFPGRFLFVLQHSPQ